MKVSIVHEDPDLLIINKPAGLADPSLILCQEYPELFQVGGRDHGACHRLDVATSGLMIFARNEGSYERMREAFAKNRVVKEYRALVVGAVPKEGKIDRPIGPDPKTPRRVRVFRNPAEARRNKAQEAVTLFTPLLCKEGDGGGRGLPHPNPPLTKGRVSTWLRVIIKTGRRHQIRAHLAAIDHPIVGDTLYKGPPADRLYLHAYRLKFRHPRTGEMIDVSSSFP